MFLTYFLLSKKFNHADLSIIIFPNIIIVSLTQLFKTERSSDLSHVYYLPRRSRDFFKIFIYKFFNKNEQNNNFNSDSDTNSISSNDGSNQHNKGLLRHMNDADLLQQMKFSQSEASERLGVR